MREMTEEMLFTFGDRWYPEVQWNRVPEQHELNQFCKLPHLFEQALMDLTAVWNYQKKYHNKDIS